MKGVVLCLIIASFLASLQAAPCCGDGRCEFPLEDCKSCPQDCGICAKCNTCGNKVCDSLKGETSCNCPQDCGPCCVDSYCREDKGENADNCPQDCGVTLRIQVVDDATSSPLPGAAVRCNIPTFSLGPQTTDSTGRVRFDGAQGADYQCTAELYSYLPGFVVARVYPVSNPVEFVIRLKLNPACIDGTVFDAITLERLDLASVFCNHSSGRFTTATRITGTMGRFYYEPVPYGNYRCYASRTRYFPNSNEGTAEPGKMTTIDIYLQPAPGGIIGHVWNQINVGVTPIPGASIVCTHQNGLVLPTAVTDATGFYYIPEVPAGSVACSASIAEYTTDYQSGVVFRSQNTTIDFILGELPGSLLVTVREQNSNAAISGATVTCSGRASLSTLTTNTSGQVFHAVALAGNYTCTASAQFYIANSNSGVVIRARQTEIIILLTPAPKRVIVLVRELGTNALITTATTTLSGGPTTGSAAVDSNAQAVYDPVLIGSGYVAGASATGYLSNTTAFGPLVVTTPTPITVTVFLAPLPCTLTVFVHNSRNISLPIGGASVTLNLAGFTGTTNANGLTSFTIPAGAALASASASLVGYRTNSASITSCPRGGNATVQIPLQEVLLIFFRALDAQTAGTPVLLNAQILWNGVELTQNDTTSPGTRYLEVDSLPVTGNVLAKAAGFNDKTTASFTFTFDRRNQTSSLAPQQFNLFFVPVELGRNGSTGSPFNIEVNPDGTILNNYLYSAFNTASKANNNLGDTYESISFDYLYVAGGNITVGGGVTQQKATPTSRSFVTSTITFFDRTSTKKYAAVFQDILPTSNSTRFTLRVDNLDSLNANQPNGSTLVDIFVPAFAATPERSLVTYVPYKLSSSFLNVRVNALEPDANTLSYFTLQDFVFTRITLAQNQRYVNVDGGNLYRNGKTVTIVLFEFAITWGESIQNIEVGFPPETFSNVTSNFVDLEDQEAATPSSILKPLSGRAPSSVTSIPTWPPTDLVAKLNGSPLANGQVVRDVNARLWVLRTYVLIRLKPSGTKK